MELLMLSNVLNLLFNTMLLMYINEIFKILANEFKKLNFFDEQNSPNLYKLYILFKVRYFIFQQKT